MGAGITAAAGIRLALQWVLVKGFRVRGREHVWGRAQSRVRGSEFSVQSPKSRVRVQGSGFRFQGSGFRVRYLHALLGLRHKLAEPLLVRQLDVLDDGAHEAQEVRHLR